MMRERAVTSAFSAKTLRYRTEEVRPGREVISSDSIVVAKQRLQIRPSAFARGVNRDKVEPGEKALHRRAVVTINGTELDQGVFDRSAKGVAIDPAPRRSNDASRLGELVAALAMKQRRVELPMSQITGAAKDDEIEWLDLDNAYGHDASVRSLREKAVAGTVSAPSTAKDYRRTRS